MSVGSGEKMRKDKTSYQLFKFKWISAKKKKPIN